MFELEQTFIDSYITRQPEWGPVGYITYKRTYARPLDSISGRHAQLARQALLVNSEEWWLTVTRVVEGTYEIQRRHCETNKLRWDAVKAQASAQIMYDLIFNFKFTPPGRGLWMMGAPVVDKIGGAALNNCAFVSTKFKDADSNHEPFCFLMDMSMLGVGVGFDTLGAGKIKVFEVEKGGLTVVVEDSREGWVGTLENVLDGYFSFGWIPEFDYSKIRPAGAPIKSFGGVAAGSGPLITLVERLTKLLDSRAGGTLSSTDITDIMNMIGVCVVSGNVRRSAELALGSPDDDEFLNLKNYNDHPVECASWRWASNNSIAAKVGMDYTKVAGNTALNGEPGYVWLANAQDYGRMGRPADYNDKLVVGVNPCAEQSLEDRELCCLAEVYPSRHETYDDLERTLKYCYLYTKTVTLVATHNTDTNAVISRNRRIGVSMTGVVQAMNKHGVRTFLDWCDNGYTHLRARDKQYSRWLGVPESVKITSVKPSGTVSLLAGVTPGVHFPHSEYYYRVIRFASNSPYLGPLREAGYAMYDVDGESNTVAVYFAVKEEYYSRGKADVTMWEQLELAAQMQEYWADNQVSITVTFKPEEAKDIKYALPYMEKRLKSVSFLPLKEHGYTHAPYQTINFKEDYAEYIRDLKPINWIGLINEKQDNFCDGDKCELPGLSK